MSAETEMDIIKAMVMFWLIVANIGGLWLIIKFIRNRSKQ